MMYHNRMMYQLCYSFTFECQDRIKHHVPLWYTCVYLIHDKQWICKTYHNALKQGLLPAQAKANNSDLKLMKFKYIELYLT